TLTFDHEGRPIQFDTWLVDLQFDLLSDSRGSVSLFDRTSRASLAPPATADSATRSQWLTRDAAARLAICNHLPLAERPHFGQHKNAKALYDAVVARYSSPATAALGRLILPYLLPELSAFATCVPPDPGIEVATLGASESDLPGTAPAEALHTFTLDPGASRCFFRDSTTLTPLSTPVPVRLVYPSGGPVLARSSTVLSCPAVPSGSLSGLHPPSFSTNSVSTAALQDAMVTSTTPGGQRVSICTCTRTGRYLATFTRRPGTDSLDHCLGHPSLPRLRGMHSRLLVSGLPRSLPHLPPSPAPPWLACVEGRQCAAPHSSSFPPTTAPLQTLHMDVWGPACVSGQGRERYFQLVVDDSTRYTTVFPLCSKGEVPDVLIPWIRTVCLQLRERSLGGRSYLHDPCGCSPFSVAVCSPVLCASAQPLAPCLLLGDLAYTTLDREGWRCGGVPGLGLSCLYPRYVRGQALHPHYSLRLP
ncbi:unnamed protein product, partial [Closterium sp. NIES-53]